jgi:hypothetical protein
VPRRVGLALAVALLALPVQAEILEIDLLAPGDGLVTRDTETGLDWLDLGGVTTNLSYDAIQAGAGGWLAAGWRYATEAEVCQLFVAHAGVPSCDSEINQFMPAGAAGELVALLGNTGATIAGDQVTVFVFGIYDDGSGAPHGHARISLTGLFSIPGFIFQLVTLTTPDLIPSNANAANHGSFLVRATPPQVPALPRAGAAALAAILALAARRLRRRR